MRFIARRNERVLGNRRSGGYKQELRTGHHICIDTLESSPNDVNRSALHMKVDTGQFRPCGYCKSRRGTCWITCASEDRRIAFVGNHGIIALHKAVGRGKRGMAVRLEDVMAGLQTSQAIPALIVRVAAIVPQETGAAPESDQSASRARCTAGPDTRLHPSRVLQWTRQASDRVPHPSSQRHPRGLPGRAMFIVL